MLYQLQVNNLNWEVSFGHVIGWTPQQSLCLLLESDRIPPEIIALTPQEWNPESVIADFVGDGFLQMMDNINKRMN